MFSLRWIPRPKFHATVVLLGLGMLAGRAGAAVPPIVPAPHEISEARGSASLSASWTIRVETGSEEDRFAAQTIVDEAHERFGWTWQPASDRITRKVIALGPLNPEPGSSVLFREQGYVLRVTRDSITIRSATATGRFYGAQTLRQLLRAARGRDLSCLLVRDQPEMRWRGVSDDISRGQVSTVDDFQDIIRRLAYYKMNLYQPYIEDMYAFRADSAIGKGRGALDENELRAMVAEGRRHHVVVSPIFQTLGHQTRLLSQANNRRYAELQPIEVQPWTWRTAGAKIAFALRQLLSLPAEAEPITPWSFSPAVPGAYRYVKGLVDEIAVICPAPFFHIGGDEALDLGTGMSRNAAKEIGVGGVMAAWFNSLHDHLRDRHHTRAAVYSDGLLKHPEAALLLPKDLVVVDWHYSPEDTLDTVRRLHAAGFRDVLISPGLWTWSTFHPNYERSFRNIAEFAAVGRRDGAMGCVVAAWGDGDAENLRSNNWLGYTYAAEAGWSTTSPPADEFVPRFVATEFGSRSSDLARAIQLVGWQQFEATPWYGRIFHRKPRLRARGSIWRRRMEALDEEMQEARTRLAGAVRGVRTNQDELKVLEHSGRRFQFIADRELVLDRMARRMGSEPIGRLGEVEQRRAIADLEELRDRSIELIDEYRGLWLERNKEPRVGANLLRMRKQTVAFDALLTQAQQGSLQVERRRISVPSGSGEDEAPETPLGREARAP